MSVSSEPLAPLDEARRLFPGRSPSLVTLRRYCTKGVYGIVLESTLLLGRRHTSVQAISRFLDRLDRYKAGTHTETGAAR